MFRIQSKNGRFFVHAAPETGTRWPLVGAIEPVLDYLYGVYDPRWRAVHFTGACVLPVDRVYDTMVEAAYAAVNGYPMSGSGVS